VQTRGFASPLNGQRRSQLYVVRYCQIGFVTDSTVNSAPRRCLSPGRARHGTTDQISAPRRSIVQDAHVTDNGDQASGWCCPPPPRSTRLRTTETTLNVVPESPRHTRALSTTRRTPNLLTLRNTLNVYTLFSQRSTLLNHDSIINPRLPRNEPCAQVVSRDIYNTYQSSPARPMCPALFKFYRLITYPPRINRLAHPGIKTMQQIGKQDLHK